MRNDRFSQVENQFEIRSQRRDDEIAELRTGLAAALASQGDLKSANIRIEGAIEKLKPAGPFAIWAPTIATLILLGSLEVFIPEERVKPIEASQAELRIVDERMINRTYEHYGMLNYQKAKIEDLERNVHDMDQFGARRWVEK